MRHHLAILLAFALTAARPAWAIVGPSTEGGAIAPSVVMVLQRAGSAAGFCSGVVVAPDAVLTAAHCVPPGADLKVHYRDGTTPVLRDVAAVVRHPGYRADAIVRRVRSIDLALLRLTAPLPAPFHPATLGDAEAMTGTPFQLAGFGLTREGVAASSGQLRLADVTTRPPLSDTLLWADDSGGAGACTGDSGGPVLRQGSTVVVGLIAWSSGKGRAQCGSLTQAIWLKPQRPWIDAILAQWESTR